MSNAANHDELNELEDMQSYCHNTECCRRFLLLKHFDGTDKTYEECLTILPKHKCCDICILSCNCDECLNKSQCLQTEVELQQIKSETRLNKPCIDCDGKKKLKEALQNYKDSLCQEVLLVKSDLSTGFSDKVVDQILAVCDQVHSTEDIMEQVDVWDTEQAAVVLSLIQKSILWDLVHNDLMKLIVQLIQYCGNTRNKSEGTYSMFGHILIK